MYVLERRLPMDECQTFGENFDEKLEVIEFEGTSERGSEGYLKYSCRGKEQI